MAKTFKNLRIGDFVALKDGDQYGTLTRIDYDAELKESLYEVHYRDREKGFENTYRCYRDEIRIPSKEELMIAKLASESGEL